MKHSDHEASESRSGHEEGRSHYLRFAAMILASFAAMYVLMYAMVNAVENALPNNNQLYMAGLMAAAMAIVELAIMGGMYPNKKLNLALVGVSILALAGFWFGNMPWIRQNLSLVIVAIIVISLVPVVVGYVRHRAAP